MRFVVDSTWTRVGGDAVLAGSPMRLFRVTDVGAAVLDAIERGADVEPSAGVDRLLDRLLDAGAVHPAPLRRAEIGGRDPSRATVVTPQRGGAAAVGGGRLVVDDASDPPLDGAAVRLDVNVGPGGARNAGRAAVETPFVLFLDADVDVAELDATHPDHRAWWERLLRHLDDPAVGLVAPRVIGDDRSSLDLGSEPARIRAGTRVSYAPGAALLVRVAAFDDVGGFDAALRSGEDVDLVWRLDQAGWRCRYEPGSVVHHRPRATWRERLAQQVKYGSSSGPLARRHPGALAPVRLGGWSAAVAASAGLGHLVTAAAVAALSAEHLRRRVAGLEPGAALGIAVTGHLATIRQLGVAFRRAWWPLALPLLWSRRARRLVALGLLAPPRQVVVDLAFSVGLWRSVVRSRDLGPLVPGRA